MILRIGVAAQQVLISLEANPLRIIEEWGRVQITLLADFSKLILDLSVRAPLNSNFSYRITAAMLMKKEVFTHGAAVKWDN